jgi:hypothetical protein
MAKAKQYGKAVELALAKLPHKTTWLERLSPEQLELVEELRHEYQHGILVDASMDNLIAAARAVGAKVGGAPFRAWVREPVPRRAAK